MNREPATWVAENDDIPITVESGSFDTLIERIRQAAPETLAENGKPAEACLNFPTHRRVKACA